MAVEVGEVEVALRAKIGQLESDLRKAEGKVKGTAARMKASFAGVSKILRNVKGGFLAIAGVAVGIAGGAFVGLSKQAIQTANNIGDVASKLGVSTSALQEFQYAANQSGVPVQTLNMGLQRFGRRAAEAAAGTGEARDAIKQLDIQLTNSNGSLRKTEDLFSDAIRKLGEIENPLERVRLGFKLFDSEGVALVNMAGGLDELRAEAQSLGLVLDDEVIKRSDELQDSFDSLWAVTKGQLTPALVDLGGRAIQDTLEVMAELAGWANKVYRSFADIQKLGLSNAQSKLTEQQEELAVAEERLAKAKKQTQSQMKNAAGAAHGRVQSIKKEIEARKADIEVTKERIKTLTLERSEETAGAESAAATRTKTVEEEKRADRERLKRIDVRKAAAQKAHNEWLTQSGQRIQLIQEELERDIEALSENLEAEEDYTEAVKKLRQTSNLKIAAIREEDSEKLKDELKDQKHMYHELFEFMEDGFSDAMATMLLDGELTFKSLAKSFAREFLQRGISQMMGKLLGMAGNFFTGGGGESVLAMNTIGNPFGAKLTANGGWRSSNSPLLVGERGPELFIPSTSGFVANNQALGQAMGKRSGGAVNVTVINNTGEESTTSEKDGPNGQRQIEVMIGKAVTKNINRGGDVDQAIRNSYGVNRVGRHGL